MSDSSESSLTYRRIRAPRNHGEVLHLPAADQWTASWNSNVAIQFNEAKFETDNLVDVRKSSRQEIVEVAIHFTKQYRDTDNHLDSNSFFEIVMSGHQPSLFHPGVWYKNFILDKLGKQFNCIAINLVVDNDVPATTQVHLPIQSKQNRVQLKRIPFDANGPALPYENKPIADQNLFRGFAKRAAKEIEPLVTDPIVQRLWPYVLDNNDGNLGMALSKGRHRLEQDFGLQTLELPISVVAQTNSFVKFTWEILQRHSELQQIYNSVIADYRQIHKIKNTAQPIPELESKEGWIETPFWIWDKTSPNRKSLYARKNNGVLKISDSRMIHEIIEFKAKENFHQCIADRRICIRPKALMTTMFSRLIASDLFIHGIGGSKYDQLTDEIATRFFQVSLPDYLTTSGTFMLQKTTQPISPAAISTQRNLIRQIEFHPEKFIEKPTDDASHWINEKRQSISQELPAGKRLARHLSINQANQHLSKHVSNIVNQQQQLLQQMIEQSPNSKILNSREFSFCLYDQSLMAELIQLADRKF